MRYSVEKTKEFAKWFDNLNDKQAQKSISVRIVRAEYGLLGNCKSLHNGVSEMKIDIGKGYRVYFTIRQQKIIFLLLGGNKSTQQEDIKKAVKLAEQIK